MSYSKLQQWRQSRTQKSPSECQSNLSNPRRKTTQSLERGVPPPFLFGCGETPALPGRVVDSTRPPDTPELRLLAKLDKQFPISNYGMVGQTQPSPWEKTVRRDWIDNCRPLPQDVPWSGGRPPHSALYFHDRRFADERSNGRSSPSRDLRKLPHLGRWQQSPRSGLRITAWISMAFQAIWRRAISPAAEPSSNDLFE